VSNARSDGDGFTARLFRWSAIASLCLIVLLITADTVLRYVVKRPLEWSQEVAGLALFVMFCAGLPHSWTGRFHVRMDLVYDRLGPGRRRAIDALACACALLFGGFLTVQAALATQRALATNAMLPSGDIPVWPFAAFATLMAGMFTVVMFLSALRRPAGRGA
jgi:TRAP-type C4-dicarboxylate transport system permease small subunit